MTGNKNDREKTMRIGKINRKINFPRKMVVVFEFVMQIHCHMFCAALFEITAPLWIVLIAIEFCGPGRSLFSHVLYEFISIQAVYNKEDSFFDQISCEALERKITGPEPKVHFVSFVPMVLGRPVVNGLCK